MKDDKLCEIRQESSLFWWILGTFFIPISIPLLFVNFWKYLKERKYRNCLPGQVVVITGASSGLGESLAHVFYKAGCKVVLASRRKDELDRVRSDLLSLPVVGPTYPPVVMPLDLAELNDIPKFSTKILSIFGHIDILINNGGLSVRSDIISSSIDVDLKVMLVNYFGTVALTKAFLPSMIKRKEGRIIFISSVQGKFALPFRSAYSASKHALQAFSDSLRAEVTQNGIKVTCISPGYIKTSLSVNALTSNGSIYGRMDETTLQGYSPEIVAKKVLKAILRDDKDIIVAQTSAHLAYWIRYLCPSLYFWIMDRRAQKVVNDKK